MTAMAIFLSYLQFISALLLILLVLLHTAKSEGIASIGGSAQMFKSASQIERGLNLFTWIVGVLFMVSSALLSW